MGFELSLISLESVRRRIADYVVSRYGVELFNTTTAGMVVDLVAVLVSYMQISRSLFLREANIDTAINPVNFFEVASNYGYLLSPCRSLRYEVEYVGSEPVSVSKWTVLGSAMGYDVVALESKVLYGNDRIVVGIGFYEFSDVVASKDYDTVYEVNRGKYLADDELDKFRLSAYPFDLLQDPYLVLRSAGFYRTKFFFGSGVLGGYLVNYPLSYKRLSFNEDIVGVDVENIRLVDNYRVGSKVQDAVLYPTVEEFRSGIARYSIDKRLVSAQDYELFIKEFYDVYDCKAYNYSGGEIVVRFMSSSELVSEEVLDKDLEKRKIIGASVRFVKEDLSKGQDLSIEVRSNELGVVGVVKKLLLYKYIPVGTVINSGYINKLLFDAGVMGYVVSVRDVITIQRVDVLYDFNYGFIKQIDVKVVG